MVRVSNAICLTYYQSYTHQRQPMLPAMFTICRHCGLFVSIIVLAYVQQTFSHVVFVNDDEETFSTGEA